MLDLSTDVIEEIFSQLNAFDVEDLLGKLDELDASQSHPRIEVIRRYAYGRLYRGKILIYSNKDKGLHSIHDKTMTVNQFSLKFNIGDEPSGQASTAFGDEILRTSRPRRLDFRFIREPTDYVTFVKDLTTFSNILDSNNKVLNNYLQSVCQADVYINGKAIVVEPTTSFLTSVLKVLISLSNTNPTSHMFCEKLTQLTISSTDIGQYFLKQWGTLFSRFKNVNMLDLSDNLIGQVSGIDNEHVDDILGTHFQWPPQLEVLVLDRNFINRLSAQFINNLPSTIRSIYLNDNALRTVGIDDGDMFHISQLPNLQDLNMRNNNQLVAINGEIFNESDNFKFLRLQRCNITNTRDITVAAFLQNFSLFL